MKRYKKRRDESYIEASERIVRVVKREYKPKTLNDFLVGYDDYMGVSPRAMTPKEKQFKKMVVDTAGYKAEEKPKKEKVVITKRKLTIPAKKKGKVVFAERTFVRIKGRQYTRFRDRRGQFASIKG